MPHGSRAYLGDRGLRPGDRVGVMLANRPEFAMVFYGVLHAGAVVVPMDPLRSAREVEFFLTNTGARLLVFAPSCGAAATAGALAAGVPANRCRRAHARTADRRVSRAGVAGDPRPRRQRGHPAHVRHDRGAQGRPTHPQQPGQQPSRHCAQPAQHWARRRRAGVPATV